MMPCPRTTAGVAVGGTCVLVLLSACAPQQPRAPRNPDTFASLCRYYGIRLPRPGWYEPWYEMDTQKACWQRFLRRRYCKKHGCTIPKPTFSTDGEIIHGYMKKRLYSGQPVGEFRHRFHLEETAHDGFVTFKVRTDSCGGRMYLVVHQSRLVLFDWGDTYHGINYKFNSLSKSLLRRYVHSRNRLRCQAGNARACFDHGQVVLGIGKHRIVPVDKRLGMSFVKRACALGKVDACELLVRRDLGPQHLDSRRALSRRCCYGHGNSCHRLGTRLLRRPETPADVRLSRDVLYVSCTKHGPLKSCYTFVQSMTRAGTTSFRSPRLVRLALQHACTYGHAKQRQTCWRVVKMMQRGIGGQVDRRTLSSWMDRSCNTGHPKACRLAVKTNPNDSYRLERACWFGKSHWACARLGYHYEGGWGEVELSKRKARYWRAHACKLGHKPSCSPRWRPPRSKARYWRAHACRLGHQQSCKPRPRLRAPQKK